MASAPIDVAVNIKGLSEVKRLEKRMEALENDVVKLNRTLPRATNNIRRMGAAGRTAAKGIEKATKAAKAADTQFGKLGKSALIAFKGFIAFQGLRFLVNSAAEIERVQVQLTTLTGSLDNARIIYEQLDKINKKSPFGTQELVGAAATLRGFGIRLENLVSTTESLGKISAATGRDIQGIALAYGQVRAKGRLQGEELLQFQERGIPLVAELAKQLGVQEDAIAGMVSKGKIGFKDVQTAIKNLTTEQGKFADAFNNTADTTFARLSNFQDALMKLAASVFSLFEPVFTWVVENLTTILNMIETAVKRFQRVQQLTPKTLQGFRNQAADEANEKFGFFDLSGDKSKFFNDRLNELIDGATGGKIKLDLSFDPPELPRLPGLDDGGGGGGGAKDNLAERLRLSQQNLEISKRELEIAGTTDQIEKLRLQAARDILQINYELTNTLAEETDATVRQNEQLIARNEILRRELELTQGIAGVRKKQFDDLAADQEKLRASLNNGPIAQYMTQLQEELGNTEGQIVQLAQSVESSLGSAMSTAITGLLDGTQTAEQAFANLFRSIAQSFIQMATQMIAKALIMKALGILAPGAGAGAGGEFGVTPLTSGMNFFGGGRAKGGPVTGGTTYLVGEQGPELFTPSSSGNITPNSALGGDTVVNITVNENGSGQRSSSGENKEDAAKLARMIENSTLAVINREKRPGGSLSR